MTEPSTETVVKPFFDKTPGEIPNGLWTLTGPKGHRTIKVVTVLDKESPLAGKRIVYVFVGSDNTSLFDYAGVAFLNTKDGKDSVKVWKRQQGTQLHKIVLAWLHIIGSQAANGGTEAVHVYGTPDKGWEAYKCEEARHCLQCNRTLTNPESIARGIGPKCAGIGEGDD